MARVYAVDGVVPVVHPTAFVHPDAVLTGDVIVGPRCYVGPCASLRGDMGRLVLEEGSNVQDNCTMHGLPGADTVIEADGHVGHGAVIHGARIGRNALVGMNAVVMDGAVIGADSFVAAMALVRAGTVVPPRKLAAGIPARVLRDLSDEEIAWKSAGTRDYQHLAELCLARLAEAAPLAAPEPDRSRIGSHYTPPLRTGRTPR
jgi:phenylacetic acid degradation protein